MSNRNVRSSVRSLAVATLLLAASFANTAASAQETILLETIGAVRMAPPDEVWRLNADREPRLQSRSERHPDEQDASAS